jgi:Smg protein
MKDSLFELLMNFFEKTLTQIKETRSDDPHPSVNTDSTNDHHSSEGVINSHQVLREQQKNSLRVFTPEEQFKFTKASYQFMMRLMRLGIITPGVMEEIIHQLLLSDSAFVTLQETKWAIRNILAERLSDPRQLAFLDMVLYQKEDKLPLH